MMKLSAVTKTIKEVVNSAKYATYFSVDTDGDIKLKDTYVEITDIFLFEYATLQRNTEIEFYDKFKMRGNVMYNATKVDDKSCTTVQFIALTKTKLKALLVNVLDKYIECINSHIPLYEEENNAAVLAEINRM